MAKPTPHAPVLLILAAFSRHDAALDWARGRAEEAWGPIALESQRFDFAETDYYQPTMGAGLRKVFFAFERLVDAARLPEIKLQTNACEEEYAGKAGHAEPRPLNLDPGYLTLGKLVLGSTKDFAQRIYLRDGVYAEVTLTYRHHCWQAHEYTFPDYRRGDYQEFFSKCRGYLHELLKGRAD